MGVTVTFNYQSWIARYPEFGYLDETLVLAYFNEATVYHRNDGGGPVNNAGAQLTYLNMLTAHIAALNAADQNGNPASTLVGRINSAGEGSVNVGTDYPMTNPGAAWFNQTRYGAAYWAATRPYRTARYLRGWNRNFQPWPFQ